MGVLTVILGILLMAGGIGCIFTPFATFLAAGYIIGIMLFVYGTEDFSKTRFILMSLCPNIIFGMIPLILYFLFPQYASLGTLGALAFSAGAGDYVNVFHALTEVPNGAKVYCNGIHTYWYKTE